MNERQHPLGKKMAPEGGREGFIYEVDTEFALQEAGRAWKENADARVLRKSVENHDILGREDINQLIFNAIVARSPNRRLPENSAKNLAHLLQLNNPDDGMRIQLLDTRPDSPLSYSAAGNIIIISPAATRKLLYTRELTDELKGDLLTHLIVHEFIHGASGMHCRRQHGLRVVLPKQVGVSTDMPNGSCDFNAINEGITEVLAMRTMDELIDDNDRLKRLYIELGKISPLYTIYRILIHDIAETMVHTGFAKTKSDFANLLIDAMLYGVRFEKHPNTTHPFDITLTIKSLLPPDKKGGAPIVDENKLPRETTLLEELRILGRTNKIKPVAELIYALKEIRLPKR